MVEDGKPDNCPQPIIASGILRVEDRSFEVGSCATIRPTFVERSSLRRRIS
jgi:hypothetical protein